MRYRFARASGFRWIVIHDWGSVLGFEYAMEHEDNVAGIAFMEAIIPPRFPSEGPIGGTLGRFRTAEGEQLILEQNMFVEQILRNARVGGSLTEEEMRHCREPYPTPESRLPTLHGRGSYLRLASRRETWIS